MLAGGRREQLTGRCAYVTRANKQRPEKEVAGRYSSGLFLSKCRSFSSSVRRCNAALFKAQPRWDWTLPGLALWKCRSLSRSAFSTAGRPLGPKCNVAPPQFARGAPGDVVVRRACVRACLKLAGLRRRIARARTYGSISCGQHRQSRVLSKHRGLYCGYLLGRGGGRHQEQRACRVAPVTAPAGP